MSSSPSDTDSTEPKPAQLSTADTTVPPPPAKPDAPKVPFEQRDFAAEIEAGKKQERTYSEEYQHQIERFHQLDKEYEEKGRPLLQNVQDGMTHLEDVPKVQTDPTIQKEIDQYRGQQPNGGRDMFGMIMFGLALAFTAFGRHRGWGAQAGIMQGFGNAFKAYNQNKKDLAKEQLDNAYRIQELVRQENTERNQEIQRIYQNRRLNLEEKKDLFNTTEKMYGMDAGRIKQEADVLNQQIKTLHDQERANTALMKLQMATHNKISTFMFQSTPGKAWRDKIIAETGGKIDPGRSEGELAQAQELLPYGDFEKYYETEKGKTDPKTGEPYAPPTVQGEGFKQSGKDFAKKFFGGE